MVERELPERSRVLLDRILEDNTSGSNTLIKMTSELIGEMGSSSVNPRTMEKVLLIIVKKHRSMAGLIHLVDRVLEKLSRGSDLSIILETERIKRATDLSKLVENSVEKVLSASRIITISNSSTIIEILKSSSKRGAAKEIILSEGRPAFEGRLAARELSSRGIDVTLVSDGALFQEVQDSDMVFVGADSVTEDFLVNKAGTLGLASTAREFSVPIYSVFTTDKMISREYYPSERKLFPEKELMEPERGINIRNYYFDMTPIGLFSGFITEHGEMKPTSVQQFIDDVELGEGIKTLLG